MFHGASFRVNKRSCSLTRRNRKKVMKCMFAPLKVGIAFATTNSHEHWWASYHFRLFRKQQKSFTFFHHWNYSFAENFAAIQWGFVNNSQFQFSCFQHGKTRFPTDAWSLISVIDFTLNKNFSPMKFFISRTFDVFLTFFSLSRGNLSLHNLSQTGRKNGAKFGLTVCNKCSHVDKKHYFFVLHSIW